MGCECCGEEEGHFYLTFAGLLGRFVGASERGRRIGGGWGKCKAM